MTALTDAQLRVVTTVDGHLLVDAGAGSGKTTTVVQALCHQLGVQVTSSGAPVPPLESALKLEQIAAITFTNQAAADLKRKFRAALRAGGSAALAGDVDSARIGTIHSFCAELLREFALRAGAPPGRRILEEGEADALAFECAQDALRECIEDGSVAMLDALLTNRRIKDIGPWVKRIAADTDRLTKWGESGSSLRPHERALLEIARRAVEIRLERMDREGLLDNDLMIVAARDMLKDPGIRRAAQQRIRLLVLDELQDVDPAQWDIAYLLGGIEHADPAPTRLIMVGDPKQSIYRFRRADVTQWSKVAARLHERNTEPLLLVENFRSKAAILGLVDYAVGAALSTPLADDGVLRPYEVPYTPLEARAPGAEGDHAVEFMVVPAGDNGKAQSAAAVRELDAAAVARRITELHNAGTPFGDVAILLAGWGAVESYERALGGAGIPAYVLRGEGFWETREVLDCLLALRAVRDPADNVAMAGFLKSPFVGVRDDTLLALARAGGTLASALRTAAPERELLDRAVSLLDSLAGLRDRVTIDELLRRLLDASGYVAVMALAGDGGAQQIANIRKLIRIASAAPEQSLGGFLRIVAEQRELEVRVAPERLHREQSDVVTITSVHSAKGLEWPVVFWADLVREPMLKPEKLLEGREAFRVKHDVELDDDGKPIDPVHSELKALLESEHQAEARRLWYVATTRAKERLILSGIPLGTMRGASSPAAMLRGKFPALAPGAEVEYTSHDGSVYHAAVRSCDGEPVAAAGSRELAPDLKLPPARIAVSMGSSRLSATQLMTFEHDRAGWWDRYVLGIRVAAGGAGGGDNAGLRAAGVVVHRALELYEGEGTDLEDLIEVAIASADPDAEPAASDAGAAYRARLRERIQAALASPVWKAMSEMPGARRELGFTHLLSDGSVIVGVLDLAAREKGLVRVLDVKNSDSDVDRLTGRYGTQAAVYLGAVRAITGEPNGSFTLLVLPAGESASVEPKVDLAELVRELRGWSGPEAR